MNESPQAGLNRAGEERKQSRVEEFIRSGGSITSGSDE
jgi:hypothetical protein